MRSGLCNDIAKDLPWAACLIYIAALALIQGGAAYAEDDNAAKAELFQSRLPEQDYSAGIRKHLPDIMLRIERPRHGPPDAHGALIIEVERDSQATRIGLTAGSVITAVDDIEIFDRAGYFAIRTDSKPCKLTWLDRDGKEHSAGVEQGSVGFRFAEVRERLAWYLRSDLRDAAWDMDMFLAIHLLEVDDPARSLGDIDLAETALARAVSAGFQDSDLLVSLAADVAFYRLDLARSWELISKLPPPLGENRHLTLPGRRLRIALANNQFEYIEALLKTHGLLAPTIQREKVDNWLKLSKEQADKNAPINQAKTMRRRSIVSEMQPDTQFSISSSLFLQKRILSETKTQLTVAPGNYYSSHIKHPEGLGDFEIVVNYGVYLAKPSHPDFPNALTVAVYDRDSLAKEEKYFDYVDWFVGLQTTFPNKDAPDFLPASAPFPGDWRVPGIKIDTKSKTIHEVKLIRVGGRAQVFFDGQCLLDTAVKPDQKNLMLMAHCVGLHLREFTYKVYALETAEQ